MSSFKIVKLVDPIQMTISGTFTPKGAYAAGTDYAVGDQVGYNGSSYIMYNDAAAGTLPTDSSYWGLVASKGDKGDKGDTGDTGATGAKGDKGDTGAKGDTGSQGIQGTQGVQGDPGVIQTINGYSQAVVTLTTADVADSTDKRYVTDADLTVLGNTSGTNSGDNATNTQYSGLDAAKVNKAGDTMSGNLNMGTNKLIGGTGVADILKLQATTGNGTAGSAAIQLLTGDNGATTALTVLNNGNVGMGTTSPVAKLQVDTVAAGTIGQIIRGASAQTADLLQLQNSSANVLSKFTSAGNLLLPGGSSGAPSLSFTSDPNSGFYSLATNYFGVSAGGSLVATYQNNSGRKGTLLYGNTYSGTVANAVLTLSTDSSILATHSIDQTNKKYLIQPYESGVSYNVDTILNSLGGNVGIGTTSPSEKLEISGTVKATGYKSSDGSAGVSGSFTTTDGKTITIKDGLVVSIV